MKKFVAIMLATLIPIAVFASDNSYKVTYDGGSLPGLKAGVGLHLYIDQDKVRFVDNGKEVASVPASAITEITYGQDVHRRVGAAIGLESSASAWAHLWRSASPRSTLSA